MAKGKKSRPDVNSDGSVLTLKLDSQTSGVEPVQLGGDGQEGFATPCTFTGLGAGLSGGLLGYVFGFGGYWMRNRLKGTFKSSLVEGWGSAKSFAIMGGLYATVTCFMKRIRQKEDGWNGAAAGCATGLALGWSGGPASAAQSCALFGIFSFFLDNMAGTSPAQAAGTARHPGNAAAQLEAPPGARRAAAQRAEACAGSVLALLAAVAQHPQHGHGDHQMPPTCEGVQEEWAQQAQRSTAAVRALLSPALPLLAGASPCSFGGLLGESRGCRVRRGRYV